MTVAEVEKVEAREKARPDSRVRLGRVDYVFAAVLSLVAVALTWDAWADIWAYGLKDEESSHVMLVPVAVAWIAWVRREALARCPRRGTWVGVLIASIGLAGWVLGWRYDVQIAWHLGAVAFATGAGLSVLGAELLKRLWPAFLVLVLLAPVPSAGRLMVARPMQGATAAMTADVAEVMGLQVLRSGHTLEVNGRSVTVAEACNGMRMAFTLLLACYVFAFTTPLHNSVRLLILLASPLVAIVANVTRLVPTIWVFGSFGAETSQRFHDLSGWAMLFAAFLTLTGLIKVMRWLSIPVSPRGVYAQ